MFNKYNYNTKHMGAFPSMLYRVLYWRKIDWGVWGGLPEWHSFKRPMWLLCTLFWASIFCTFYPPKISWSLYMYPEAARTWQYLTAPCTPGGNEELCLTLSPPEWFLLLFIYFIFDSIYHPFEGIQVTAAARAAQPFLAVCAVFSCVHKMVWLPVFEVFNVRTLVDTFDCTQSSTDTVRKSALKVSWKKNPHQELKFMSVLQQAFQLEALPNELSPLYSIMGNDAR